MNFKTEDIVSVGTGILAGKMDGVYEVLDYMTGDNLFTHQLPDAADAMKEEILRQCPWLNEVNTKNMKEKGHETWLKDLHEEFGTEHDLVPSPNLWGNHDPIEDLLSKYPDKKIVGVAI